MKTLLIVLAMCARVAGSGQSFAEWFHQKKTQISYLHQQIAALEIYEKTLARGYAVTRDGTNIITYVKQEDFNLHSEYFGSLGRVNPIIRRLTVGNPGDRGNMRDATSPYLTGLLTDGWFNMTDDERYDAILAAKKREGL